MMQENNQRLESPEIPKKTASRKAKVWFAILEICFVGGLLAVWLLSETVQNSKSLWILFFYSFPSQFLIAIVPHEPVFLFFSKFHPAWWVTTVAIVGVLLTELLNYHLFNSFADTNLFEKVKKNRFVNYMVKLFNRAPFLALWITAFTPIPFYPLRFLVVFARYPIWKYLLAVFLARTPRFYLIAVAGQEIQIPDQALIWFFIGITVLLNLPLLKGIKFRRRKKAEN